MDFFSIFNYIQILSLYKKKKIIMSELQHIPNFKKANMMKIGSIFVKHSSYIYDEHATSLFLEKSVATYFQI
jgi:hypothetical protein